MTDFVIDVMITLETLRCWGCKRWFGWEKGIPAQCPHCAEKNAEAANQRITELEKSNSALRGVIARKAK